MAGSPSRGSWLVLGALGALVLGRPACDGPGPAEDPFDATALLTQVGGGVILPALRAFSDGSATELAEATSAYAAALDGGGDGAAERGEAQGAFHAAMDAWQELEMMSVGPAAPVGDPGGLGLRDEIDSFPTVNPCLVDQRTTDQGYAEADFFLAGRVNSYGLDALEYLLFAPAAVNDCPSQVDINASGTWAALGAPEINLRRAAYAEVVAARIQQDAERLRQAWEPGGGDFGAQLVTTGEAGSIYESDRVAVNAVFDALFALELLTKDRKLGLPLGLLEGSALLAPEAVESPWADRSMANVQANLRGFRALFSGGEGAGFDDLLLSLGQGAIAEDIGAALDAAEVAAAACPDPFEETLQSDGPTALAVHAAVKGVADLLKGDLVIVLVLQIPSEAASDND